MERSASILAGMFGSYILALGFGHKAPTGAELFGAVLLVLAIVVLALGPRLGGKRPATVTSA
jgi:hypothetical protein